MTNTVTGKIFSQKFPRRKMRTVRSPPTYLPTRNKTTRKNPHEERYPPYKIQTRIYLTRKSRTPTNVHKNSILENIRPVWLHRMTRMVSDLILNMPRMFNLARVILTRWREWLKHSFQWLRHKMCSCGLFLCTFNVVLWYWNWCGAHKNYYHARCSLQGVIIIIVILVSLHSSVRTK